MIIALSGWFAGRPVGSGRYVDHLTTELRRLYPTDELRLVRPVGRTLAEKLAFEQVRFPLEARGAQVAHVPYWAPPLVSAAPVVVTVHDLIPLLLPDYRRNLRVRAYTALVSKATVRAAAVIADSETTRRDVIDHLGIDSARVSVVPLGVDTRYGPGVPVEPVRKKLELPQRYALYFGGSDPRKRLGMLIDAWPSVFRATGVPLVVAGAGIARRTPQLDDRRTRRQPWLRRLGEVDENLLPGLYAGADVFVFPSTYEGFGLTPLEAMASGTPPIVTDASSTAEVVGDAGIRLASEASTGDWSAAAVKLLGDADQRRVLAARGISRARLYTWERTARETHAVYEKALGTLSATGPRASSLR